MAKIERDDIQIISRHSNWSVKNIDQTLKENIYSTKEAWQKFLRLFFISLGVSFTIAGIIFFFAYNWAHLDKFFKIGLVEGLITATTLVILFSKLSHDIKNIILTGAAMLVGVLFAVFGQIYQTGANAYDFFLGWTLLITLWVAVSNFAPLWLIFILLTNTTIVLYSQQIAHNWSFVFITTLLFSCNSVFLIATLFINKINNALKPPHWFTNSLALAVVTSSTIGISFGLFDNSKGTLFVLLTVSLLAYSAGIWYGLKARNGFYLSVIPFSVIVIISALLIKLSDDFGMFFLITIFVITSVTLVIKNLINLQKKWIN
ncbi:DUF2157 domain-containing protein [Bizionia gelidisalsuginis]|uniref:DUF2157 domain-containing protein n=1 Tax=Bizionia gelidisalsuginis TaxID=291188 RepID=A0ABY3MET4_9FLAO|nr:DUF2157 domain-containing protein [Bizionia gelidisalsuginis]TYC18102.1 DUF2157 domain-containing protein [Bizionia gelidisalsuginis]